MKIIFMLLLDSVENMIAIAGYILDKPGEFFDDFDIVILGRSSLDLKVYKSYFP